KAQAMFGVPKAGDIDYTSVVSLDLGTVAPSLAGPKRPQDRIEITNLSSKFAELFSKPVAENGFNQPAEKLAQPFVTDSGIPVKNGDVLIAAITSCTNTSNPGVLLAAGLLAKKAVEAGLKVAPHIKTSLAPGSRIVTEYLQKAGLLPYLEKLGFNVAAYGCTTCIGNAGDLTLELNKVIQDNDLVCAAVLSGNRNFEARIHPNLKANFLASPPLVVAYAIAGTVTRDLMTEPVGYGKGGKPVYLGDIWPGSDEIYQLMKFAMDPQAFKANYDKVAQQPGKLWDAIKGVTGQVYTWPKSTYIAQPPFFEGFTMAPKALEAGVKGAKVMALFGDSITTDHISPAGSFKETTPAGKFLLANGVIKADFNSYGARRGNHEVMMRGTFANVRVKNLMLPARPDGSREEGGYTLKDGQQTTIYDAAMAYIQEGTPTVIFAGEEYGTGSSRDWAAKGTQLLGIKAVIAKSFERIHRSNLIGMGVLPLQFKPGTSWESLGLTGAETIDITLADEIKPQGDAVMTITRPDGSSQTVVLILRIDTAIEVDYYRHGGILPFVLRQLLAA
ncbi:MAG TPA: aconitate hydratase AcnA, partial [Roseateles sp.]